MSTPPQQTLPFTTLDVFTSTLYTGNPLALVLLPQNSTLKKPQKQLIAKEFNLSETVFLHQSASTIASEIPEWQIDIFTPDEELPFAGHPTIGAASYVLKLGEEKTKTDRGILVTKAGKIPISLLPSSTRGKEWKVQAEIPHNTHLHKNTLSSSPNPQGLSLNPEIKKRELKAPLFSIVKGMTFLLVEIPSLSLLEKIESTGLSPSFDEVLDHDWAPSFVSRYYYVLLDEGAEGKEVKIRTRMVEAKMEDPATGSAASALCAYLAGKWGRSGRFEIVQGVEMGRRSEIGVEVQVKGEGEGIEGVMLSGAAVVVMDGKVSI